MRRSALSWLKCRSVRSNRCDALGVGVSSSYSFISLLLRFCRCRAKGRVLAAAKVRGFGRLLAWSRASAAEGAVATRACLIRIASRRSVGDRRANSAYYTQAPEKCAHGRQRPGDEARKAGAEQRRPEKGAARRRGQGVLVSLKRGRALRKDGGSHSRYGGPRSRAATDDTSTHPAVAGVHLAVGSHHPVLPRSFQVDLPTVGDVILEKLLHLLCEFGVLGHQIYLPVGGQAA